MGSEYVPPAAPPGTDRSSAIRVPMGRPARRGLAGRAHGPAVAARRDNAASAASVADLVLLPCRPSGRSRRRYRDASSDRRRPVGDCYAECMRATSPECRRGDGGACRPGRCRAAFSTVAAAINTASTLHVGPLSHARPALSRSVSGPSAAQWRLVRLDSTLQPARVARHAGLERAREPHHGPPEARQQPASRPAPTGLLARESGRFRPWRRALWATAPACKSWAAPFPVGPGDLGHQEHSGAGHYRICRVGAGQVRFDHRGARQVRMAEAGSILGCDRKAPVRSAWRRSHARTQHTVSAAHPSRHGAPSTKSDKGAALLGRPLPS